MIIVVMLSIKITFTC